MRPMPRRPHIRLAAGLVGGALASKLLGLFREILQARLLGATILADSFRGALGVSVVPIAPLQGEAIVSVLIPLHREWKSEGVATRLFSALIADFFVASTLIAALIWVFADAATSLLVGGFGPEAHQMTVAFVRIVAFSMPAYVVSAIMSSSRDLGWPVAHHDPARLNPEPWGDRRHPGHAPHRANHSHPLRIYNRMQRRRIIRRVYVVA